MRRYSSTYFYVKIHPTPTLWPPPQGIMIWTNLTLYTTWGVLPHKFQPFWLMVFEKNFLKWQQFFNNKKTHLELSAHADELKMIWYNHSKFYRQLRTLFNSLNSIKVLSVTKIPASTITYQYFVVLSESYSIKIEI